MSRSPKADEIVWVAYVADYSVRKRQRKLFERDEVWRVAMGCKPTACFPSEREARAHMVDTARAEVSKAERELKRARAALLRAEQKLAGVK